MANSKEFNFISELRPIQTLLTVLESKLYSFKQIFPKLHSRRGLFNFGGSVLKTQFGTAIVAGVTHKVFDELQSRQQDVVHSLNNQVTYIKRLYEITNVNVEAIANLSGILRDNIIRSHDKFQEITRDILWLNLTIHGQNELYTSIREMEFSILPLTQQLDELINAILFMVMGTLPVNLINTITLRRILKNMSFNLRDSYDLLAGTRVENIHLYDIIKVTAIAIAHQIKMVMDVPLKTANRHFILYKIFTLSTRVANGTFIQYLPEFLYFGINDIQHNYVLYTEAELNHCTKGIITVCPVDKAMFSTRVVTCASSLFFQSPDSHISCPRKVLLNHQTPLLHRYESIWI